jgi:hypothetical protein
MTILERIQALVGTVTAYDGRLCLWANSQPRDIRDVAASLSLPVAEVCDAMPVFERKRNKRVGLDTPEESL